MQNIKLINSIIGLTTCSLSRSKWSSPHVYNEATRSNFHGRIVSKRENCCFQIHAKTLVKYIKFNYKINININKKNIFNVFLAN